MWKRGSIVLAVAIILGAGSVVLLVVANATYGFGLEGLAIPAAFSIATISGSLLVVNGLIESYGEQEERRRAAAPFREVRRQCENCIGAIEQLLSEFYSLKDLGDFRIAVWGDVGRAVANFQTVSQLKSTLPRKRMQAFVASTRRTVALIRDGTWQAVQFIEPSEGDEPFVHLSQIDSTLNGLDQLLLKNSEIRTDLVGRWLIQAYGNLVSIENKCAFSS
jgi:hypothetical protein